MQKKTAMIIVLLLICLVSSIFTLVFYRYKHNLGLLQNSALAKSMMKNDGEPPNITDVKIILDGDKMPVDSSLYLKDYRLYIPIEEFVAGMGGKIQENNNIITVIYKDSLSIVDIGNSHYSKDNIDSILKEKIWEFKGKKYIDFFDIENIMGFWSEWEHEKNKISIYSKKNQVLQGKTKGDKIALIRLEDVGPGGLYRSSLNLTKLKIIGDYLYSRGIPFHIAWIPRYLNPNENYDYDPLKEKDLYGAEFVYTFDYMINKGAVIGLHGYTHQTGNAISGIGYEFYDTKTNKVNCDRTYMEETVLKAIETAQRLKIQYYFYESPHYWADKNFRRIMESHFKYLYQSDMLKYGMEQKKVDFRSNGAVYIPTPLGFVKGDDNTNIVVENLEKIASDSLASFFFHPFLEFKYINLNPNGKYTYDKDSKLHKTIDAFDKKGYKFISINEIKQPDSTVDH